MSLLFLFSCKGGKPEMVGLNQKSVREKPSSSSNNGRMTAGSDTVPGETGSYLIRGRAAIIQQNSYGETSNLKVRGAVEL